MSRGPGKVKKVMRRSIGIVFAMAASDPERIAPGARGAPRRETMVAVLCETRREST